MIWFEAQRFRAYPSEIVAGLFGRFAELGLFVTFWLVVSQFAIGPKVEFYDILSYYMIVTGIMPFFYLGFGVGSQVLKLIKSGELNQTLIRPISPILHPWAMRTGRNAINLSFGLLQIIIGMIIGGGLSLEGLPFLLPVLFNTILINAAFNLFIGTIGFYIVEADGFKNGLFYFARVCRGELIPLYLMPVGVATFLQYTPLPASQYHLAILLQGVRLPEWQFVLIGSLWSVGLMWLALKTWKRGLRHYEAVGI